MKRNIPGVPAVFFLLLFLGVQHKAGAQQLFDSLLNISANNYPQEKIHIHFDKTLYNPGETVWFKAYLTTRSNPSQKSNTVYAELLDGDGKMLQRKIMPVINSGASSFFELDTVYHSRLFVRAYTSWMLNFDASLVALQPITLINPNPESRQKEKTSYTLAVFPEGGDLVQHINSRVAFKANDNTGVPVTVSGTVTDSRNNTVASFRSEHDGMGTFSLTPAPDEVYTVTWTSPDGVQHRQPLPAAKSEGFALRVYKEDGILKYSLSRPGNAGDAFKKATVVAQMNQQKVYEATIKLNRVTSAGAAIATDSLTDGIMVLTVFNANNTPVAERLVFLSNNDYYFNTGLHTVEKNLAPHGKTVLQIDISAGLASNLSVAVTDAGLEAETNTKQTIFSDLLLTSDLKGYVYNPAWYFASDADSVKQYLDLVMLTNGWRRYKWEDMLANKWPVLHHQSDDYISIRGKISGINRSQFKDQSLTAILNAGKPDASYLSIPVNEDGSFKISGLYFFDTAQMYYKFGSDDYNRLLLHAAFNFYNDFETAPSPAYSTLAAQYFNTSADIATLKKSAMQNVLFLSAVNLQKAKTLKELVVKTTVNTALRDEQYKNNMFGGGPPIGYDPAPTVMVYNYIPTGTKWVNGVSLTTDAMTPGPNKIGAPMAFFLDNTMMPINRNSVNALPGTDFQMVKVLSPPVLMGTDKPATPKGLNAVTLNGYSAYKEFYMPDYDKTAPDRGDYRSTLYWNPFVIMDAATRTVTLPVFNSSNCKKIKVVIEGMNELGQLTRVEKVFE